MKKLHVTIQNGGPIQLVKCGQCCTKYHCPFCKPEVFKPTLRSKVRKHIKVHEKRAVRFKEYSIFKCSLNCKPVSHFHCPKCSKLLGKKQKFLLHLKKCVGTEDYEDQEDLSPLIEEQDLCNVPKEEEEDDADSCSMSEEQESPNAFDLGEELHVTIQNGGPIQLVKCGQCCTKYHCPFCKPEVFKPTSKSKVRKHIKAHEKRAVRFKGYLIFKCGLNCRPVSHFHCPECCRLLEKKNRFMDHLSKCTERVPGEDEGQSLPVKQEADPHHVPKGEENDVVPDEKEVCDFYCGAPSGSRACDVPRFCGNAFRKLVQLALSEGRKNFGFKMVTKCCVPECRNKGRRFSKQHFHRFPKDVAFCRLWLAAMKHRLAADVVSRDHVKHLRVCSDHFLPEDYRKLSLCNALKPAAVPSLFTPNLPDQGLHPKVGPRPALPAHSEASEASSPQPDHKLAFANPHDSASSRTFVDPKKKRKEGSRKTPFVREIAPTPPSACSKVEEKSWGEAVKSLQTAQETNIFKSSEVQVNTRCLLELFQFCWLCREECCITIEGSERLFSVTQDCQSCGYQRDWRSHPTSAEPVHTFQREEEHAHKDENGEEVVVQILSSDNECSEQVFIKKDGSYLSNDEKEVNLQEKEVTKKRKRESNDGSDELEPGLDEEAADSDVSMDEDLFTAVKEDAQGKLVVWCTQCETKASLSCSVLRHKKVFCCAQCSAEDGVQTHRFKALPVRFDDLTGFQKHVELEHRAELFYKPCQDCGKFVVADLETGRLNEHKCEHKSKFICPECGKRLLTEVGLKSHHTQLHSGAKHPCKYCLKVFKTRSAKLEHEQTHHKEK